MDQGRGVTCTIVQVTSLVVFVRVVLLAGLFLPGRRVDDVLFVGRVAGRAHVDGFCHRAKDRFLVLGLGRATDLIGVLVEAQGHLGEALCACAHVLAHLCHLRVGFDGG